jgi:hypothetical protein
LPSGVDHGATALEPIVKEHIVFSTNGFDFLDRLIQYFDTALDRSELQAIAQWPVCRFKSAYLDIERRWRLTAVALPEPFRGASAVTNSPSEVSGGRPEQFERLDDVRLPRSVGTNQDVQGAEVETFRRRCERKEAIEPEASNGSHRNSSPISSISHGFQTPWTRIEQASP